MFDLMRQIKQQFDGKSFKSSPFCGWALGLLATPAHYTIDPMQTSENPQPSGFNTSHLDLSSFDNIP